MLEKASGGKFPYQNLSLANLRGETWRDLPVFEDLYQVSSHGRIKSLSRLLEVPSPHSSTMVSYWTKERIRKVKLHKRWNSFVKEICYECTISLSLGQGRAKTFLVRRLVYQAFVKEIDFHADGLMVMHKDGDGLNNHYRNLMIGRMQDVLERSYLQKRHISPFALKTRKEIRSISKKSALSRQKKIIQYSAEGGMLRLFKSVQQASAKTGIAEPNLTNVLKGNALTAGGFVWRYYPGRKKISTAYIRKRKAQRITLSRKPVSQYSLKGKFLRSFKSVSEAAKKTRIASSSISNCLSGRSKRTGNYIWKAK